MILRTSDRRPFRIRFPIPMICALVAAVAVLPQATIAAEPAPAQADADSVRLAEFDRESADVRQQRRDRARGLAGRAAKTDAGRMRHDLLTEAAATDPTDAGIWLDLGELQRVMGYRDEALASLAAGRAAFERTNGEQRRDHTRRYCLARAWLSYDAAKWDEGLRWAERALKRDAGQAGHLISTLNRSGTNVSEMDMMRLLKVFAPLDSNTNRRINYKWAARTWQHLHNVEWSPIFLFSWLKKTIKYEEHNLTRWRDFGLMCEANHEPGPAAKYYRRSIEDLPVKGDGWLRALAGPVPDKQTKGELPFWVNDKDGYVGGSLQAYTVHAHAQMQSQDAEADRQHWATCTLNGATAGVPRYPYVPWLRLWRAEALLELGHQQEAEEDATMALAWFEEFGIDEPAVQPLLGHIRLLEKSYKAARLHLQQAVTHFPDDAAVWADLGLVQVVLRDREAARTAFDRALDLDPALAVVWHNRGLLNLHEGLADAAVSDLKRAVELAPHDAQVVADLAEAERGRKLVGSARP